MSGVTQNMPQHVPCFLVLVSWQDVRQIVLSPCCDSTVWLVGQTGADGLQLCCPKPHPLPICLVF